MKKLLTFIALVSAPLLLASPVWASSEFDISQGDMKVYARESEIQRSMLANFFDLHILVRSSGNALLTRDELHRIAVNNGTLVADPHIPHAAEEKHLETYTMLELYAGSPDKYQWIAAKSEEKSIGKVIVDGVGTVVALGVCAAFKCSAPMGAELMVSTGSVGYQTQREGGWHPDLSKETRPIANVVDTELCRDMDRLCTHAVVLSFDPALPLDELRKFGALALVKAFNF